MYLLLYMYILLYITITNYYYLLLFMGRRDPQRGPSTWGGAGPEPGP